ncbi:MAG: M48 family metallopeptidase [Candidatus Poribacteria bacterium]|nr:M48 family metallopeptidase [Candidatus Poribacteria bacterium]
MNCENPRHDSATLKSTVHQWAQHMGVTVREVHLRDMRKKWASISTTGRLTLSTELLDLPVALGEFVIVHELVHLLAPNHGRLFRSFMHAYLPDWEERQRDLHALS